MTHNKIFINAALATLVLFICFFQGCHSGGQKVKPPTKMDFGQLYLKDQPYQQLYVEIDTLEGTTVPPVLIEEIRNFLSQHCDKPAGIKIVQDPPVSFQEKVSIGLMSVLCTDGPVHCGQETAYLHVFFYDTDIKNALFFSRNPYVSIFCPTTIFINIDYCEICHDSLAKHFVQHELGHALGLCWNTDHGDGQHCRDSRCLMHHSPGRLASLATLIQLPMKGYELCANCDADLTYAKLLDPPKNYSFKGPFVIEDKGEEVRMSLPYFSAAVPKEAIGLLNWETALSDVKVGIKNNLEKFMDKINSKDNEIIVGGEYKP